MFSESVLAHTGQLWKIVLAILALVVGSVAPAFSATGMSWTTGTIIAVLGYALGVLFTRCPNCKHRWFWTALIDAQLYKPLFTSGKCPNCDVDFAANREA